MQMNRKDFLKNAIGTGVMISMPTWLLNCASGQRLAGSHNIDPLLNARENGLDTPILSAINVGITAPNPHNTQAWKFKILNDTEALLYVDENRILPETDPPARQIHIGQGTFLEHLAIGAKEMGYEADIQILPEGEYPLSEIGKKPSSKICLRKSSSSSGDVLYRYISTRQTDRTVYDGPIINDHEFEQIKSLVGNMHSKLGIINTEGEMSELKPIFYKAMEIECLNHHTYDESRIWFRYNDSEIYEKRDGISFRTSGMGWFKRKLAESFVGKSESAWHEKSNINAYLDSFNSAVNSSRAIVYWETQTNKQADWIKTGRDYARFQLAITSMGLRMHPMSQVLQEYKEMNQLSNEFNGKLSAKGRVQMLVRLGRGSQDFYAPRRDVRDMIIA
ncbi:MAG: hypothetical protein KDK41_06415 [Leptospiraceae bacterium]|nr:hypothetical protein [Leptospiraceae bacterium]